LIGVASELVDPPIAAPPPAQERRFTAVVSGLVGLTVIILLALLISDFINGRKLYALRDPHPIALHIIGRQWWWEVQYQDPTPSNMVITANEIHIPAGRPIKAELEARDVIHSFWAPNLHGKKDLIPGHSTTIWFQADRAGRFDG